MHTQVTFEVWFYRGLIAALFAIIAFFIVRFLTGQDKINKQVLDAIQKHGEAIIKITEKLDSNDRICELKHDNIEEQLVNIEHRGKNKG